MREIHSKLSLEKLCGFFEYRRQNFYQVTDTYKGRLSYEEQVVDLVEEIRVRQPRIGTLKLQMLINIKLEKPVGRDKLFGILGRHNLLIRRVKKYRPQMTNGNGVSKYLDLRKGLKVERINQLWCSDFTYISLLTRDKHCYLVLITDEYSHLIVGYHIGLRMRYEELSIALMMAIKSELKSGAKKFGEAVIFHSDRGSQYKSEKLKAIFKKYNIFGSMCSKGKSQENPVAERINGILKNEVMQEDCFNDFEIAKKAVEDAIEIYNEERPHLSCDLLTPRQAHARKDGALKKRWRQRKPKKEKAEEKRP